MKSFESINFPRLKKLVRWKQEDEESKWAKIAEECLRKKIKKSKQAEEELNYALANPGHATKCVTLPRTVDGRIQISQVKALPHVVSCRIWRWDDLQSNHELESLDTCLFPYSTKQKDICINPYHYRRVVHPVLPPVLVPPMSEFAPKSSVQCFSTQASMPVNVSFTKAGFVYSEKAAGNDLSLHKNADSYSIPFKESNQVNPQGASVLHENMNSTVCTPVYYQEPKCWSSIHYYEFNNRIGEIFQSSVPSVQIDGYSDPSNKNERFCLGMLPNINRSTAVEKIRSRIGQGVRLTYTEGSVYVECLSDLPVFCQSRSLNHHYGFHPSTICKILSGCSLRIINNQEFSELLSESTNSGYGAVSELAKLCAVRVSFVKGWGSDYNRRDVTSTPCWIEIVLHGPLQWLDRVLSQIGPPTDLISSLS